MKPIRTWILIADSAHARVLEHTTIGGGLRPVDGLNFSETPLKASELAADRPGRTFASGSDGRSAMEPRTDPVDKREADFAASLANIMDNKRTAGAFDRLIIAAAPGTLGNLRKSMPPQLQEMITAELPKDLTKVPNDAIAKHFADVLAV